MDAESSLGLVERAKAGDASALERLIIRYLPRLRRWTRRAFPSWARDGADTDDLVQETVWNAVRNLPHFTMEGDHALRAYMKRAARNRVNDEIKRIARRPRRSQLSPDYPSQTPRPDETASAREDRWRCRVALCRLRIEDRRMIETAVANGGDPIKLAELTGKPSPDAARMALSRALQRLAREMRRLA
jgi:RNA polymerase sigma-70 factor (ECF subfamily)